MKSAQKLIFILKCSSCIIQFEFLTCKVYINLLLLNLLFSNISTLSIKLETFYKTNKRIFSSHIEDEGLRLKAIFFFHPIFKSAVYPSYQNPLVFIGFFTVILPFSQQLTVDTHYYPS